jgi:hypothetical protein
MSRLEVALPYAADGLPVVPLHTPDAAGCSCRRPDCGNAAGKHPRTLHGLKDATTDEAAIRRWWGWWPDANIGIRTGTPGGIVAIDIDTPDAERALVELAAGRELGGLIVRTGRGSQRWYRSPSVTVRNSASRLGPGVDVRGEAGYVVAPPSLHYSGSRYAFAGGRLGPLPEWLLDELLTEYERAPAQPVLVHVPRQRGYDHPTTPYGRAVLERSCGLLRLSEDGHGHEGSHRTLFRVAYFIGGWVAGGQINRREAEDALVDAALARGLKSSSARGRDEEDLRRQIANAFEGNPRTGRRGGLDNPLYPPPSWRERIRVAQTFEEAFRP